MAVAPLDPALAERGKIPAVDVFFLLLFTRLSLILCMHPGQGFAPQAPFWATTLLPGATALILVPLYGTLARRFPQASLVQIAQRSLGTLLGGAVGLVVLLYFLDVARLETRIFSDMLRIHFLPRTPTWAILTPMLLVIAWAAWSGIEVLGRSALAGGVLTVPVFVLVFGLAGKDLDLADLPPFAAAPQEAVRASLLPAALFGEMIVLLMIHPFLSTPQHLRRATGIAIGVNALTSTLVVVWVVGLVGPANAAATLYPVINVAREVSVGQFVERVEGFMMVAWIATWLAKSGLFLYATALGLSHLLRLRDYRAFVLPLTLLVGVGSWFAGGSTADILARFAPDRYLPLGFGFGFALPLVLLVVSAARRAVRGAP